MLQVYFFLQEHFLAYTINLYFLYFFIISHLLTTFVSGKDSVGPFGPKKVKINGQILMKCFIVSFFGNKITRAIFHCYKIRISVFIPVFPTFY